MSSAAHTRPIREVDALVRYGPHALHVGDLRVPIHGDPPYPVALVLHGGFWRARYNREHMAPMCAELAKAGVATLNLEYRRLGQSGGGWPGTFLDVARGLDHLGLLAQQFSLDLKRIFTIGFSAGGHLALWLAARHRIRGHTFFSKESLMPRGAISLAGVSDLVFASRLGLSGHAANELDGGPPDVAPERYQECCPACLLPLGVTQILVHGAKDDQVRIEMSRLYYEAARKKGDPVELVALPDSGHFELISRQSNAWPHVLNAVQRMIMRMR